MMLKTAILQGMALSLILSTACTIKGSGSQRVRYDSQTAGAGDEAAADSGDAAPADEGTSETCLKLQEKRKNNLKLQEEGDEAVPETAEEEAACPAAEEEVPADDTAGAEEVPAE